MFTTTTGLIVALTITVIIIGVWINIRNYKKENKFPINREVNLRLPECMYRDVRGRIQKSEVCEHKGRKFYYAHINDIHSSEQVLLWD